MEFGLNIYIVISFGKNPTNGGIPPNEISRTLSVIDILVFCLILFLIWLTIYVLLIFRIKKIGVINIM